MWSGSSEFFCLHCLSQTPLLFNTGFILQSHDIFLSITSTSFFLININLKIESSRVNTKWILFKKIFQECSYRNAEYFSDLSSLAYGIFTMSIFVTRWISCGVISAHTTKILLLHPFNGHFLQYFSLQLNESTSSK